MINKRCFRPQNRANKLRLKPAERTASSTLKAVLAAALAIPGVTTSTLAQTAPDEAAMRLQYSYYKDRQAGGEDRVRIRSPLALYLIFKSCSISLNIFMREGGFSINLGTEKARPLA